jgi:hypothetical protein
MSTHTEKKFRVQGNREMRRQNTKRDIQAIAPPQT